MLSEKFFNTEEVEIEYGEGPDNGPWYTISGVPGTARSPVVDTYIDWTDVELDLQSLAALFDDGSGGIPPIQFGFLIYRTTGPSTISTPDGDVPLYGLVLI